MPSLTESLQTSSHVSYNLLIIEGDSISPTSSLDDGSGVGDFQGTPVENLSRPCVVVKVVDRQAKGVLSSPYPADPSCLLLGLAAVSSATPQDATCVRDGFETELFPAFPLKRGIP